MLGLIVDHSNPSPSRFTLLNYYIFIVFNFLKDDYIFSPPVYPYTKILIFVK